MSVLASNAALPGVTTNSKRTASKGHSASKATRQAVGRVRSSAKERDDSLVAVDRFVQATRDSGYKGTSSAIAELVDNALQAGADRIIVSILPDSSDTNASLRVDVLDNGCGMDADTLRQALRFGGSSRFNDRRGLGRYGMGLPNSSFSQARRVDVCSWRSARVALATYLDLDEIANGTLSRVPEPKRVPTPASAIALGYQTGTLVTWSRCDRLDHRRPTTIAAKLRPFLGRVFRYFIWEGVKLVVNDEAVQPIDPLFLNGTSVTQGGRPFGEPLEYDIDLALADGGKAKGRVVVRFSELPVEKWHHLSNEEKSRLGVSKAAGVSVVRATREIDYGWFFMGDKRKENYDDWWRCEVLFEPSLDEAFGITHTKQQIRPIHDLLQVLVPDIEATAKALNRRVRQAHEQLKTAVRVADSEALAAAKEPLLPPLPKAKIRKGGDRTFDTLLRRHPRLMEDVDSRKSAGLRYAIVEGDVGGTRLFRTYRRDGQLILALNVDHPFYKRLYKPLSEREDPGTVALRRHLDLILLAAARSEAAVGEKLSRRFLDTWSDAVATFLQS